MGKTYEASLSRRHILAQGHPELDKIFGDGGLPIALRWIEGRFVVTAVGEELADKSTGIEVGDVLLSVDGEPVEDKAKRLSRLVAASNEGGLRSVLSGLLLAGPNGSEAVLSLSGRADRKREVTLQRDQESRWFIPPSTGDTVRLLADNLGYVDLTRLTSAEVDGMLEKLKDTRGIIFDMRGYPRGIFWILAPRLNTRGARYAAIFRRAQVSATSDEEAESGFFFSQPIAETDQWKYTGKTVMLIDERAISQSEHTGLFLEAANGTKFIGTPTAGANGDVTTFVLPGNLTVSFTGHDVRHADGRQLQRTGLVPDVEVAPTIQSVREGKDVVLERAVQYLNQE